MIRGTVEGLQALVAVSVRIEDPPEFEIECVVDTGFEGALALPRAVVLGMGLPYLTELDANLADDTNVPVNVHVATVVWNGVERDVAVLAMGRRPLLGTALLDGFHLGAYFVDGGSVTISPLE